MLSSFPRINRITLAMVLRRQVDYCDTPGRPNCLWAEQWSKYVVRFDNRVLTRGKGLLHDLAALVCMIQSSWVTSLSKPKELDFRKAELAQITGLRPPLALSARSFTRLYKDPNLYRVSLRQSVRRSAPHGAGTREPCLRFSHPSVRP